MGFAVCGTCCIYNGGIWYGLACVCVWPVYDRSGSVQNHGGRYVLVDIVELYIMYCGGGGGGTQMDCWKHVEHAIQGQLFSLSLKD